MKSERDTWLTEFEFVDLLSQQRGDKSKRKFAAELGVSDTFLGGVLSYSKPPGELIPEALGFEPVTLYRPITQEKEGDKCPK